MTSDNFHDRITTALKTKATLRAFNLNKVCVALCLELGVFFKLRIPVAPHR